MIDRPLGARRRHRRAACWIVVTAVGGAALAQSTGEAPALVGFKAGAVVIAPSLTAGYAYDNNVFQQSEDAVPPPSPDGVLTLQPAIVITVPFSNSAFRFGDTLTYLDYSRTAQTAGKTSNDAEADLTLNFGSRDQLELSAHNVSGVAQTIFLDPGNSLAFEGNSFTLHNEAVAFSRVLEGARGYRFALERNALRWNPPVADNFFNYRGFDGEAAYLQPLSPNTRLAFGYIGTRYDHFDATDPSIATNAESGDTVYGQVEGQLGPRQPYSFRLGWERLGFGGSGVTVADNFSGIIAQGQLSAIVGGGTMFTVRAERQPYRSYVTSNNYYIYNVIGLQVERYFPRGSSVGGNIAFSTNGYNQPDINNEGEVYFRQDRRVQLEAYGNLAVADRVVFRVSLARYRRYSNAPGADYNNTVVFGGFVLGWI